MRDPDFRRATPSLVMLLAFGVGKLNQAFYLLYRKRREPLLQLLDGFPEVVAADDCLRHDTRSAHNRPSRNLTRNLFDQFASRPVDFQGSIELRHALVLLFIVASAKAG